MNRRHGPDEPTRMRIQQILLASRIRGTDPVAALDAAGFLRHRASRRRDALDLIDDLIDMIDKAPVERRVVTALDMRQEILNRLRVIRKAHDDLATQ